MFAGIRFKESGIIFVEIKVEFHCRDLVFYAVLLAFNDVIVELCMPFNE